MIFQLFQLISYLVVIFHSLLVVTSRSSDPACYMVTHQCPAEDFLIRYPFYGGLNDSMSEIHGYFIHGYYDYSYNRKEGNRNSIRCGYQGFEIKCRKDDGKAVMNISNHLYRVLNIHYYDDYNYLTHSYDIIQPTVEVVDVDVDGQECPHPRHNLSFESAPSFVYHDSYFWTLFYNCSSPPKYIDGNQSAIKCLDNNYNPPRSSYAVPGQSVNHNNCKEIVFAQSASNDNYSETAKLGFNLSWSPPSICTKCERNNGYCYYDDIKGYQCAPEFNDIFKKIERMPTRLKWGISVPSGVTGIFLILLYFYWKTFCSFYYSIIHRLKKKNKIPINVEALLGSYGGHALQRYKYLDIKMMTYSFKDKLGQGGYGSVFKGTCGDDGRVVAVKVLNESKGNGEEFINEVVTIGRTNHVNVVSLLGYCNEGKKRALVYEFMPNGSLEKFIYNTGSSHQLGWKKLYHIAVGIARGLEYLHCRCNTRILHFDIKPHNILLDHDFSPKISDFGLAKLCPTRESVVSMIGTRGTWGYTAPEIGCRNLGGVSHKSDVYSYGMMVLEMIGGRKNLDVNVENSSGIYFPHWIYNQLTQDGKAEGHKVIEIEDSKEIFKDETAKMMIVVALWCIQTHPANRPSMTKVVEMLEGSNEELQMPPNPSLDPASTSSS
ncbi:hypothetical protein AQUCO_04400065v1 [Aquilegia coerulea]|uniref:Protein kinase domain-containing protein n=1 Tax=Aquilegia coerulea TaxID=218851 RepID=A0A2G5CMU5_AQUCA|nr:hypothetical protein AQUCO_04400065v1 [Aquilegia coerulea]